MIEQITSVLPTDNEEPYRPHFCPILPGPRTLSWLTAAGRDGMLARPCTFPYVRMFHGLRETFTLCSNTCLPRNPVAHHKDHSLFHLISFKSCSTLMFAEPAHKDKYRGTY